MATNSLAVARRCIEHLRSELSGVELEGVRSVFVSGSYVRGDWLDGRSDLDIGLVTDCDWERGFAEVQRVVADVVGEDGFDSHEEGGIDWNLIAAADDAAGDRLAVSLLQRVSFRSGCSLRHSVGR